jgi:hypothetical protein
MILIYESSKSLNSDELILLIINKIIDENLFEKQVVHFSLFALILTSILTIILLFLFIEKISHRKSKIFNF